MLTKKATTKAATAVALVGKSGAEYLTGLRKELENIVQIAETPYRTSGTIESFGTSINIREEQDTEKLTMLVASANYFTQAMLAARNLLGETSGKAIKFEGHLLEDIVHDVILRKKVLNSENRRKTLEALMEKSKRFMTVEDEKALFEQELAQAGVTL